MQRSLSVLIRTNSYTLKETVELWRGQTATDPRPNKALNPSVLAQLLHGYSQRDIVVDVAKHGVQHEFQVPFPASTVQANHRSAHDMHNALVRSLRGGQDDGTYIIVDMDIATSWQHIQFSPFGCVEKKDADPAFEARLIHNLSFPRLWSTNDMSNRLLSPPLQYRHVSALAKRIEQIRSSGSVIVKMLKGDVKGAFRHIPLHASIVRWFAGSLPSANAAVLDLSLPFGWSGSPAYYGVFGNAISWLLGRESPASLDPSSRDEVPFFAYEWVDDHILLETDRGDRLQLCESALRLAMLAVLGPRAINESKFSAWETKLTALGLEWDTAEGTVYMPIGKIAKARLRIAAALRANLVTRRTLDKLLGSLRHVCSCIRSAKPFYQRLVALWHRCPPFKSVPLTDDARLDLLWFDAIVREDRLRHVPTSLFCDLPDPEIHLYMDASNTGLCVLHPSIREYIRVPFDDHEQQLIAQGPTSHFTINVREQLSAIFALLVWFRQPHQRPNGRPVHIRCWLDNRSAVAWCNGLQTRNPLAQELNRVVGALEAEFSIRLSADHLAGASNVMADLGSRAWSPPSLNRWTDVVSGWSEQIVPAPYRKIYDPSSSPFSVAPSLRPRGGPMTRHGSSGAPSVPAGASPHGNPETMSNNNRYSSFRSLFTAGPAFTPPMVDHRDSPPCDPSSATLLGVIAANSVSTPPSTMATNSLSAACVDAAQQVELKTPSQPRCSVPSPADSISPNPTSASFLGLRWWASSFYSEDPST